MRPSATLNATDLTVRRGADRRWTLQQIAGLPEVLNVIKQMSGGIISEHRGKKATEQQRGARKSDRPKVEVRTWLKGGYSI